MTNGEKMQEMFPEGKTRKCRGGVVFESDGWCHAYHSDWWDTEYKESTAKNDLEVDCIGKAEFFEKLESTTTIGLLPWQRAIIYQVMDKCKPLRLRFGDNRNERLKDYPNTALDEVKAEMNKLLQRRDGMTHQEKLKRDIKELSYKGKSNEAWGVFFLESIANSLAVIADYLTEKEAKDADN